VDIVRVDNNIE